ncbi:MAG: Ig-like domain-containing protein [Prevotellaceae bacterium]|jgi:hypothetical protein|nr:Ig-like domain-containing protein [Prevotellaceae bacterium]
MKKSFLMKMFVCLFTVTALYACGNDEKEKKDEIIAVTGVTLDQSRFTLAVGDSKTLTAVVSPDNATNKEVRWSSSDTEIATVDNGVVTAVAEGSASIIVTAVDGEKTAEAPVLVLITASAEEFAAHCRRYYRLAYSTYLQIDSQYSTLEARQDVTSSSRILLTFLNYAYKTVNLCNQLIERLDSDDDISEADKNIFLGQALAYRAASYFYLKTLFGGVPLIRTYEYELSEEPSRASVQEINDFIRETLDEAKSKNLLPANDSVYHTLAIIESQNSDAAAAYTGMQDILDRMAANSLLSFTDVNNDGIITADEYPANTMTVQIYLLYAEISLNSGNTSQAIETLNILRELSGQSPLSPEETETVDNIRTAIRDIFDNCNTGMKYLNLVRWNLTSDWGYRILLPIPLEALDGMPQNEGW